MIALARASWLHFADRTEMNEERLSALRNLGAALANWGRLDEGLLFQEEILATFRQNTKSSDDGRILEAEESVAVTKLRRGGAGDLNSACRTLMRIYQLMNELLGGDHEKTLYTAGHLADATRKLGMFAQSISLLRRVIAGYRRLYGDTHCRTLEGQALLAQTLVLANKVDEAREVRNRLLPISSRILGPDHRVTRILQNLRVP